MLLEAFPGVARIDPKHICIHEMAAHKCAVVKALCELPGRVRNMYESSEGVQPSVASARDDEAESSAPDASSSSEEEEEDVEASDGASSDGSDEEAGSRESSASDGAAAARRTRRMHKCRRAAAAVAPGISPMRIYSALRDEEHPP